MPVPPMKIIHDLIPTKTNLAMKGVHYNHFLCRSILGRLPILFGNARYQKSSSCFLDSNVDILYNDKIRWSKMDHSFSIIERGSPQELVKFVIVARQILEARNKLFFQ